jgi:zinc protease
MIREPALSTANLRSDVPIVLAERRENAGPGLRVAEQSREVLFRGQRLANRIPIGTVETLNAATQESVRAFHSRWYRPENTVIVAAGDVDPLDLARLIEANFADWEVAGSPAPQPDFGTPQAGPDASGDNGVDLAPVDEVAVLVEPDLPRAVNVATLRPYEQVTDNLEYNRGLMLDSVALAIINRRLEARARGGASYLYAQVDQNDVNRSVDGTFLSLAPLSADWQSALADARGVIADALTTPPTEEEIAREVQEYDVSFANAVEQRAVMAGSDLADSVVNAVDIREAVASPEVVLDVFRTMRDRFTPDAIFARTKALFKGEVTRAVVIASAPGEADAQAVKLALSQPVDADDSSRIAASTIRFEDLPAIGAPGTIAERVQLNSVGMEQITLDNGVKAIVWKTNNEPGRATVKVRFGAGRQAFDAKDAPYIGLGEFALVGSGVGPLGQEELDRLATGRKLGFDFSVQDGTFVLKAETRSADIADQLYLFAAKLAMPRWDENPVLRGRAAMRISAETLGASPAGVLNRDLAYLLADSDPRFATPDAQMLEDVTPEGFRQVWEPLLAQGPVEVLVFGDLDTQSTIDALQSTFGALEPRAPVAEAVMDRPIAFPQPNDAPVIATHRGEADQAAAVIAWETGGGVAGIPQSRKLEILGQVFGNRLLDAMREKAGASYAPQVISDWPVDVDSGGRLFALAQVTPELVPEFYDAAEEIARDLAQNGPDQDELDRVTEPLRQLILRAQTGHGFWLNQVEGATVDPQRLAVISTLLSDYTQTTPAEMQALALEYLLPSRAWHYAILPEGASIPASGGATGATGR